MRYVGGRPHGPTPVRLRSLQKWQLCLRLRSPPGSVLPEGHPARWLLGSTIATARMLSYTRSYGGESRKIRALGFAPER